MRALSYCGTAKSMTRAKTQKHVKFENISYGGVILNFRDRRGDTEAGRRLMPRCGRSGVAASA